GGRVPGAGETGEPEQPEERHRYRGLVATENRVNLIFGSGGIGSEAGPVPAAQDDIPIGRVGRVQTEIYRRPGSVISRLGRVWRGSDGVEERVALCRGARRRPDAAVECELPGPRESGGVERS